LLTDPGPAAAPCWYAYRSWAEQGFKVLKAGGWDWEATRITAPDRAERQGLAPAVATPWLIEVGGLAEGEPRPETVPPLPTPRAGPARWARLFRVGLGLIVAGVIRGQVPVGRFVPEAWPAPQPVPEISEDEFCSQLTYP
jgi:hypothetical protein